MTVGKVGEHETRCVGASDLPGLVRWIHWQSAEEEQASILKNAVAKSKSSPALEAVCDGKRVAAAYFTALPGRVATLGGVRGLPGNHTQAAHLVSRLVSQLWEQFPQIQAIVAERDTATASILRQAGFRRLTQVRHLWLDIQAQPVSQPKLPSSAAISWLPSHAVARLRMQQLLASTFIETLDCPALNGLRSDEDVLESFLDSTDFRQVTNWELLQVNGSLAGCLMLTSHSPSLTELAYMGLVPGLRGKGFGEFVLQRAISTSILAGKQLLVVAVDERNWPARALYQRLGFEQHQAFSVWLSPSIATP